jgi:hypothetical protein
LVEFLSFIQRVKIGTNLITQSIDKLKGSNEGPRPFVFQSEIGDMCGDFGRILLEIHSLRNFVTVA